MLIIRHCVLWPNSFFNLTSDGERGLLKDRAGGYSNNGQPLFLSWTIQVINQAMKEYALASIAQTSYQL